MSDTVAALVPGWCGMIPAHPEFLGRRLERRFIHGMDAWLRAAMPVSQQALGEHWTDLYCNASIWRFLIAPTVCGDRAHIGILMSCNDSAGRYFPLVIAAALEQPWTVHATLADRFGWFKHVERIARDALSHDLSPQAIDEQLAHTPLPELDNEANGARRSTDALRALLGASGLPATPVALPGLSSCLDAASIWGACTLFEPLARRSLWWRETDRHNCEALRFDGMPGERDYAQMLTAMPASATTRPALPDTP